MQKKWFIVGGIVFLLIILISFVGFQKFQCGDGTFTGGCSVNPPYFCGDYLVERADVCGCPGNFSVEGNRCVSEFYTNPRNVSLKYFYEKSVEETGFVVYEGIVNYLREKDSYISYNGVAEPSRLDFKLRNVEDKIQRGALIPLVVGIQNLTSDKEEQAEIAMAIVQSIPYGESNLTEDFFGQEINHSRYPYEVLYDYEGICGERSELLAFLLKELGYGVAIFYFPDENHEAVGIKCSSDDYKETGYCYIETTTTLNSELNSSPEVLVISDGRSF